MVSVYSSVSSTAESTPFDNTTNNFVSDNVQNAIEESHRIPEVTIDPISPVAGQTWVLKEASGSPIGLLLSLTQASNKYVFSYKTISGKIVRMNLT